MKDIIENNALLVYSNKKLEDKLKIAISGLKAIAESGSVAIAQVTLDELDKND